MSSPWLERWRTERFAELVDPSDTGPRHHRRTAREDELVGLAQLVQLMPGRSVAPAPDPEFRSSLRAFLVASAERVNAERTAQAGGPAVDAMAAKTQVVRQVRPKSSTTGRTRLALLAGATAGALVLSGVSLASTDSLPGDALYQVKLSAERAQLTMAGSDLSKGQLYLEFARARASEAGRGDRTQVAVALAEMDKETRNGVSLLTSVAAAGDRTALDLITTFVDKQRGSLSSLLAKPGAGPAVAISAALLDTIEVRVAALATALTEACPNPASDDVGVRPDTC